MRLFLVIGEPRAAFTEPPYSTDPRHYGLWPFNRHVTPAEYEEQYRARVKAFVEREHAIGFAIRCRLMTVQCPVYDWVEGAWIENDEETDRMLDAIG